VVTDAAGDHLGHDSDPKQDEDQSSCELRGQLTRQGSRLEAFRHVDSTLSAGRRVAAALPNVRVRQITVNGPRVDVVDRYRPVTGRPSDRPLAHATALWALATAKSLHETVEAIVAIRSHL